MTTDKDKSPWPKSYIVISILCTLIGLALGTFVPDATPFQAAVIGFLSACWLILMLLGHDSRKHNVRVASKLLRRLKETFGTLGDQCATLINITDQRVLVRMRAMIRHHNAIAHGNRFSSAASSEVIEALIEHYMANYISALSQVQFDEIDLPSEPRMKAAIRAIEGAKNEIVSVTTTDHSWYNLAESMDGKDAISGKKSLYHTASVDAIRQNKDLRFRRIFLVEDKRKIDNAIREIMAEQRACGIIVRCATYGEVEVAMRDLPTNQIPICNILICDSRILLHSMNKMKHHGRLVLRQDTIASFRAFFESLWRVSTEYEQEQQEADDNHTTSEKPVTEEMQAIAGHRLFEYSDYYPVVLNADNKPTLSRSLFVKAIKYLVKKDHDDRLAAMDLVYLREDNFVLAEKMSDVLYSADQTAYDHDLELYSKLIQRYRLHAFIRELSEVNEKIFRNYRRIVNDLGDTLRDLGLEIVLHNVRNPLKSIIAAGNAERVSGRAVGEPATRFVVQFIRHQGKHVKQGTDDPNRVFVSYLKIFGEDKKMKATTTPIYHPRYGLIGIMCVNIDIDSVLSLDDHGRKAFVERFVSNSGKTPDFE